MGLAVDGEAPAENIGLDGFLSQIDPYLSDAGLIQIVHVDLNRLRPLHFEQEVEMIVHIDLSRSGRAAECGDSLPRTEQP